MTPNEHKISVKFGLTADEVAELVAVGLDTPTKIRAADPETIPSAVRAKLTRWHPQEEQ